MFANLFLAVDVSDDDVELTEVASQCGYDFSHPLVSDAVYGGAAALGLGRQALHAFKLALPHPVLGQMLEFVAPLPPDMVAALAQWGLRYNRPDSA